MNVMRKTLLASAVSMALAGGAQAGFVNFDYNGATPGAPVFSVKSFDWAPGNLVINNSAPLAGISNPVEFLAQGVLSSLVTNGNGNQSPVVIQLSYQLRTWLDFDGGNNFTELTAAEKLTHPGFFEMFYSPVMVASDITGCGFGSNQSAFCGAFTGIQILSGSALAEDGTSAALTTAGTTLTPIDTNGEAPDTSNGILTRKISLGSFTLDVDVLSYDTNFFLSDITSLGVDILHTETGGKAPFTSPNPSDEVVGTVTKRDAASRLEFFGNGINDNGTGSCSVAGNVPGNGGAGGADSQCGIQLQNDSNSDVQDTPIPAPGSLALLGLGLAAIGAATRRRRLRA